MKLTSRPAAAVAGFALSALPILLMPSAAAADTAPRGASTTPTTKAAIEHAERQVADAGPTSKAQIEHRERGQRGTAADQGGSRAPLSPTAPSSSGDTGAAAWQLALSAALGAAVTGGVVAVVPGLPVVDTVKRVGTTGAAGLRLVRETLSRDELVQVQTPQAFGAALLRAVHTAAGADGAGAGDDAGMVEAAGHAVHVVPGDPHALKITVPQDLLLAEALAAEAVGLL